MEIKIRNRHNIPIATLLKEYANKKSGRVIFSKNEIKRRFDYLDWMDQNKIVMLFLDSCMTDRIWIYKKIYHCWDYTFEQKVKEVWEKYHEPECAWAVIRFFPISYIKENLESFTGERDYYFVCLRLAKYADFVIDKSKLTPTDYLSVLYHTGRTISNEDAINSFFLVIHNICVSGFSNNDTAKLFNERNKKLSLSKTHSIALVKFYLEKLGNSEATNVFDKWNDSLDHDIERSQEYQDLGECDADDYDCFCKHLKIIRKYAYLALDNKYKHSSDKSLAQHNERIIPKESDMVNFKSGGLDELEHIIKINPIVKTLLDEIKIDFDSEIL